MRRVVVARGRSCVLPAARGWRRCCVAGRRVDRVARGRSPPAAAALAARRWRSSWPSAAPDPVAAPFVAGAELGARRRRPRRARAADGGRGHRWPSCVFADRRRSRARGDASTGSCSSSPRLRCSPSPRPRCPPCCSAWEVMGATSYALIGFHWRDPGGSPPGRSPSSPPGPPTSGSTSPPAAALGRRRRARPGTPSPAPPRAGATWSPPGSSSPRSARPPSCRSRSGCPGRWTAPAR